MVLSVVVYNHTLTLGQWVGAAVVFAGIGVEAWVKRKGVLFSIQFHSVIRCPILVTNVLMHLTFPFGRGTCQAHYSGAGEGEIEKSVDGSCGCMSYNTLCSVL